jgi:TM2 domain-containing membrane protein YozV
MNDAEITRFPATDSTGLPVALEPSSKSYVKAVVLSSVFGFVGVQHFYLGRVGEGLLDVGLTVGWIGSFVTGHPLLGIAFVGLDIAHALGVTILLFTGNFKDGNGRVVCYPGQKLKVSRR